MIEIVLTAIFILAFILIAFEEACKINKAKSTLFLGTLVWIILFIAGSTNPETLHEVEHAFEESILEIAILWLFLIAAMTFVAYMDKQGFIENIVYRYLPKKISLKKLLFIIGTFTFFFSSLADNLTATLVSLTIILALNIKKEYILTFATLIVFSANAGGVAMITGDVTTLMIFNAGKVDIIPLLFLFIPSFISFLVLFAILQRYVKGNLEIPKQNSEFSKIDIIIGAIFLFTILGVILGHVFFHIPATLSFLFGLSVMLLVGWVVIVKKKKDELELLEYIRAVEFDALFFFLGVLLLVGMLSHIGVLNSVTALYEIIPVSVTNYLVGMLSSVVDNIPLTAAMLKAGLSMSPANWLALTYAVGVGGSLLVIGSAAGVVAMSKIKDLTFLNYMKFFFAIFIAYSIGYVGAYITGHLIL